MKIDFRKLSFTNFLSFGNEKTVLDLSRGGIVGIRGTNLDSGNGMGRNGTGKSAIVDAFSYVLWGKALRGITNQKLRNKHAQKGQPMLVELEFTVTDGDVTELYRIERGESPSRFAIFRNENDDWEDITTNRDTAIEYLERITGLTRKTFPLVVINSTETDVVLDMTASKRREIMEQMFGLQKITEIAEKAKRHRAAIRDELNMEKGSIQASMRHNDDIEARIEQLARRLKATREKDNETLARLTEMKNSITVHGKEYMVSQIELMKRSDIMSTELAALRKAYASQSSMKSALADRKEDIERHVDKLEARQKDLKAMLESKPDVIVCDECGQPIDNIDEYMEKLRTELDRIKVDIQKSGEKLAETERELEECDKELEMLKSKGADLSGKLSEINDEIDHDLGSIEDLEKLLEDVDRIDDMITDIGKEASEIEKEISTLEDALVEISHDRINELDRKLEHVEYLVKILTSPSSFLRKQIMQRSLAPLNIRMNEYLELLEMPFSLIIDTDLSVKVEDCGESFDFGNLSRGQRQRANIAFNMAFQDVLMMNGFTSNVLFIDELLDSGICSRGAEMAFSILRKGVENDHRTIFVITHREDILDMVDEVIDIVYEDRTSRMVFGENS